MPPTSTNARLLHSLRSTLRTASSALSEEPICVLCISRCLAAVFRTNLYHQVAGGASVITSRAMTRELSPHLEPWYQGIVERSGGDVNKAAEEDKFHDIAFQK